MQREFCYGFGGAYKSSEGNPLRRLSNSFNRHVPMGSAKEYQALFEGRVRRMLKRMGICILWKLRWLFATQSGEPEEDDEYYSTGLGAPRGLGNPRG